MIEAGREIRVEAFIATELIGATRLPVDAAATVEEARRTFEAGRVGAVLTDPHTAGADDAGGAVPALADLTLVHGDDLALDGGRWAEAVEVDPSRPLVVYPRAVSGGAIFAVPTTYANWRAIMNINQDLYRLGGYGPPLARGERYLSLLQLMHVGGIVGSFPFLLLGLPQVLVPRFDAKVVVEAIGAHEITTMFAVPGMLTRIADEVEAGGPGQLASLRRVLYGGGPVGRDETKRLVRTFGATLSQLYGRYEAGWPLTILTPEDHQRVLCDDDEVAGSCGRAIDAVEIGLRPTLGDGLELRSRSAMTSPAFADPDGWCGLGDLATVSDEGFLRLGGRLDGMINTGAFHVYPQEVEEAILEIPSVTAARVTSEPDPSWGEAVTAYVVSTDPTIASTLRRRLRARLASYKIPHRVHLVDELPVVARRGPVR